MYTKLRQFGWAVAGVIAPLVSHAQANMANAAGKSIKTIIDSISSFIGKSIIPIMIIVALILFLWNMVQFLTNLDNEKERERFRKYSINALLALFVIFSVWGIVGIATRVFFGTGAFIPLLPVK